MVISVLNCRRPIWNYVTSDTKPACLENCSVHIKEKVQRGGLCYCWGEGLEIASLCISGCFIYYFYKTWCLHDSRQDPGEGDEGKRGWWVVIKGGVHINFIRSCTDQRWTEPTSHWRSGSVGSCRPESMSGTAAKRPKENVPKLFRDHLVTLLLLINDVSSLTYLWTSEFLIDVY